MGDEIPAEARVCLRPAKPEDREFERLAYAASRDLEMAGCDWPLERQAAFLNEQFELQDRHYRSAYEGAEFYIIVIDGHDAGRLIIHRGERVVELMDIVLLPPWRGQGLGTLLIRRCMENAVREGCRLRLWVEQFNPARRLYARLGFVETGAHGPHLELGWPPSPPLQPNTAS